MKQEITQHIANASVNPKVAALVGTTTAGGGIAEYFGIIQSGASLIAVCLGIVLTSVLIWKHIVELRLLRAKAKELD